MAIQIKTTREIATMRRSGEALRRVHEAVAAVVQPGVTTMDLEHAAVETIRALGVVSAFQGYHGYPSVLCTSVNEEVVHGMPSATRVLRAGDIVSVDCGVIVDGFYSDAAVTLPVGEVSAEAKALLLVTQRALEAGIDAARAGGRLGDVSAAVQAVCEPEGYGIVRDFVGHGIGKAMHEDPQVPNFGKAGRGPRLRAGMVLAIEPMINQGTAEVKVLADGWTAVTVDGRNSAHFEHTVAITDGDPLILTL